MRKPEPWYWKARKGWYVQVDGRQIRLGAGDPRKPPAEVMREYYRVMATNGRTSTDDRQGATVAEVCEIYLEAKSSIRENTLRSYAYHLNRLASALPGRKFNSVRKEDLVRVAEAQPRWSESTRHDFVVISGSVFRWARDAGYLDFNPFAGWSNPYHGKPRPRGISEDEFAKIMDRSTDVHWKQVMMFLRGTGCRVGELCVIEAKHVHPTSPLVVLPPDLHKTGRRTRKDRVIVLSTDVEVMVRALAARHPKGPIFRNSRNGNGWQRGSIQARFRRYRRAMGLDDGLSPHTVRHSTLTRMLDGGTKIHLVAKIAGHTDLATLMNTYYHPDVDLMVAAADKAHKIKKG